MFKKSATNTIIQVGDRFVKTDDSKTVWVVAGEGSSVTPIPHFQVVQEDRQTRRRTLSQQTLLDRDFYLRAE